VEKLTELCPARVEKLNPKRRRRIIMENLKEKCPLGGDGTQDCTGCTVNCARNRALKKREKEQKKGGK
jgi:hypothetical protein